MLQRLLSLLLCLQLIYALPSGLQTEAKQNAVVAKTHSPRMVVMSDTHNLETASSLPLRGLVLRQRRQLPGGGKGAKGGKGGKRGGGGDSASGLSSGGGAPKASSGGGGGPKAGATPIPGLENLDALAENIGHDLGKTIGRQIGSSILGDNLGGKVGTQIGNQIGGKIGKQIGSQMTEFLANGGLEKFIEKAMGDLLAGAAATKFTEPQS